MGNDNPCNANNTPDGKIPFQCQQGWLEFAESQKPVLSVKHEIGQLRLGKGNKAELEELEKTLSHFNDLLNGKVEDEQKNCQSGDMVSCGYVSMYDRFVKYFGPIDVWQIANHRPVELPMSAADSEIMIPVGDKESNNEMLFDTGAPMPVFSKKYIGQHENNFLSIDKHVFYGTTIYRTSDLNVPIGCMSYQPKFASSSDMIDYMEGSDIKHDYVALLGFDILQNIGFGVNFDRSKLTFDPDVDGTLSQGEWLAVPVDVWANGSGYSMEVPAQINGQLNERWILDTGSNRSSMTKKCADKIKDLIKKEGCISKSLAGEVPDEVATADFNIGDHSVVNILFSITGADDPNSVINDNKGFCGLMGMDVLKNFNFIFDQGTFTLYLQPRVRKPNEYCMHGVKPKRQDERLAVEVVCKNNAAERAGLLAGDVIESIDGRDTMNISILEFTGLAYPGNGALNLIVIRDGKKLPIKLERAHH